MLRVFNGFKKVYCQGQSISSEMPSQEESFSLLESILDQANELTCLKELFVDVNVFTLDCYFELDMLKNFLDAYNDGLKKINVSSILQ
jgi:hypothetical protein